jgi:hypothetical protein
MVRKRKTPPDGRANNGGRRVGQPGQNYPNRSDLRAQAPTAPRGQQYGQAAQQMRSQAAVPMAGAPPPQAFAAPAAPRGPDPGSFGDFLRPTERPDEPVTAGAPVGPGPGPEALPPTGDTTIDEIRALYMQYGQPESIREILEDLERETGWGM